MKWNSRSPIGTKNQISKSKNHFASPYFPWVVTWGYLSVDLLDVLWTYCMQVDDRAGVIYFYAKTAENADFNACQIQIVKGVGKVYGKQKRW